MGAKQSRPQTRKLSSSPKVEMAPRPQHNTRRNNTSALRIRIPKRASNSNSESRGALYFDTRLLPWRKIKHDFTEDREAEYFVYMFYDPTHGDANFDDDEYLIPSHEVMAWAGRNFSRLTQFCGREVDGDRAYLRYAGADEPAYESALLMAIRRDGRILGFATVEGWNSDFPALSDICVAKKRQGIGRDIIDTYMGYAQDNEANELQLESVESAVPFYQRLGFEFRNASQRDAYAARRYGQYSMRVRVADYFEDKDGDD